MLLLPIDQAPADCAYLADSGATFLVSAPLSECLSESRSLDGAYAARIAAEIERLRAFGFWGEETAARSPKREFSVSLHLVHGCNLRCTYCNVSHGTYGGSTRYMGAETAIAGVRFLKANLQDRIPLLVLYGGEPLLNWAVLVAAVREMRVSFETAPIQLVTNGTLIDVEKARFLADNNVETIISIDGPAEVHDRHRPMVNGGSSYAAAAAGLSFLKSEGARFHIRATWSPAAGEYETVRSFLSDLAGDERLVTVGLNFNLAGSDDMELADRELDTQIEAAIAGERPFPSMSVQFINAVFAAESVPTDSCGAGSRGVSITPDGHIYPCQVAVDQKRYRLGDLEHGIDDDGRGQLDDFLNVSSPACATCWARFYCPGPCRFAGNVSEDWPYCRSVKRQLRRLMAFGAAATSREIASVFRIQEKPDRRLETYAALRDLLWQRNTMIRPLSLFPARRQNPQ